MTGLCVAVQLSPVTSHPSTPLLSVDLCKDDSCISKMSEKVPPNLNCSVLVLCHYVYGLGFLKTLERLMHSALGLSVLSVLTETHLPSPYQATPGILPTLVTVMQRASDWDPFTLTTNFHFLTCLLQYNCSQLSF